MKTITFLVMFFLVSAGNAVAQQTDVPREKAEQFLGKILKGDIDNAYDLLFQGSVLPIQKPQAVDLLKKQTEMGLSLYGKAIGFDLIHEQTFGKDIVRLVYALKLKQHPLIWEFYFYRPRSSWILSNIMFNDVFQLLEKK